MSFLEDLHLSMYNPTLVMSDYTVELMQLAVNEFCEQYLKGARYLKLTVENL